MQLRWICIVWSVFSWKPWTGEILREHLSTGSIILSKLKPAVYELWHVLSVSTAASGTASAAVGASVNVMVVLLASQDAVESLLQDAVESLSQDAVESLLQGVVESRKQMSQAKRVECARRIIPVKIYAANGSLPHNCGITTFWPHRHLCFQHL